jgi:hypothetical protein
VNQADARCVLCLTQRRHKSDRLLPSTYPCTERTSNWEDECSCWGKFIRLYALQDWVVTEKWLLLTCSSNKEKVAIKNQLVQALYMDNMPTQLSRAPTSLAAPVFTVRLCPTSHGNAPFKMCRATIITKMWFQRHRCQLRVMHTTPAWWKHCTFGCVNVRVVLVLISCTVNRRRVVVSVPSRLGLFEQLQKHGMKTHLCIWCILKRTYCVCRRA